MTITFTNPNPTHYILHPPVDIVVPYIGAVRVYLNFDNVLANSVFVQSSMVSITATEPIMAVDDGTDPAFAVGQQIENTIAYSDNPTELRLISKSLTTSFTATITLFVAPAIGEYAIGLTNPPTPCLEYDQPIQVSQSKPIRYPVSNKTVSGFTAPQGSSRTSWLIQDLTQLGYQQLLQLIGGSGSRRLYITTRMPDNPLLFATYQTIAHLPQDPDKYRDLASGHYRNLEIKFTRMERA